MKETMLMKEVWVPSQSSFNFAESVDEKGEHKYVLKGMMLPFNTISRNRVLYNEESIRQKCEQLIGKPLMYNHKIEGDGLPFGHFISSYCKEDGWYYEADVDPAEKDFIRKLERRDLRHVSIQLVGGKVIEKEEAKSGRTYTEAWVEDVIEGSVVPAPGFLDTTAAFAEAFKEAKYKVGDRVKTKDREIYIIKSVKSDGYTAQRVGNDSIGFIADDFIIGKEASRPNNVTNSEWNRMIKFSTSSDETEQYLQMRRNGRSHKYAMDSMGWEEAFKKGHINEDEKDALLKAEPELKKEIEEGAMKAFHQWLTDKGINPDSLSSRDLAKLAGDFSLGKEEIDTTTADGAIAPPKLMKKDDSLEEVYSYIKDTDNKELQNFLEALSADRV